MGLKRGLEDKALSTIKRYRMLEGGERVVVSVSGGPDSLALFLLLHRIAGDLKLDLHVFHLDHMLRGPESEADARFVEELASSLGAPVRSLAVDVRKEAGDGGGSPQDAARKVRMSRLRQYASEVAADRIATGHTADDQVETFLMRVIQGAGLTGLGGIPPVSGTVIRPLIEVWRSEVEEYCADMDVSPRCDSSNLDTSYLRNHVRLRLVPFLVSEFGGGVKEVILREVESLALDREFVAGQAAQAFDLAGNVSGGRAGLDIPQLLSLPVSLQRGAIREAWSRVMPGKPGLAWQHVIDILDKVVAGRTGARLDLPGPVVVVREYDEVVLRTSERQTAIDVRPAVLSIPGNVRLPWAGVVIEARLVGRDEIRFVPDPAVEYVRPDVELPLEVREPRPGDRFHPLGSAGTRKLKDFFIDIKLPRARRIRCPLVFSGGEVVWVAGHRLDERFRLRDTDREAVMLIIRPVDEYDVRGADADCRLEGEEQGGASTGP
jgi:tRNA(Ile)-lysidine synthase